MQTKWDKLSEFRDGSGEHYFRAQCPQLGAGERLIALYEICWMPSKGRLWFWDCLREESESIRMKCETIDFAESVKAALTVGKSHWMEAAVTKATNSTL